MNLKEWNELPKWFKVSLVVVDFIILISVIFGACLK